MANLKISELPEISTIQDDYPFAVVDNLTNTTSKVTITGMTFQGGTTAFDSLAGVANMATPISFSGDSTEFLFTGTTIDIKRVEATVIVSVLINYKSDAPGTSSSFRLDIGGTYSDYFELPQAYFALGGDFQTITVLVPMANLNTGSQNIDLYFTLENTITFDFAQVYITAFEL